MHHVQKISCHDAMRVKSQKEVFPTGERWPREDRSPLPVLGSWVTTSTKLFLLVLYRAMVLA